MKCSEILAHIKLLYNPRVNKVFTSLHKQNNCKESDDPDVEKILLGLNANKACGPDGVAARCLEKHLPLGVFLILQAALLKVIPLK